MIELEIRLSEQLRIYKASPNVTATYADLARMVEDLLTIIELKKINGFSEKGEK